MRLSQEAAAALFEHVTARHLLVDASRYVAALVEGIGEHQEAHTLWVPSIFSPIGRDVVALQPGSPVYRRFIGQVTLTPEDAATALRHAQGHECSPACESVV